MKEILQYLLGILPPKISIQLRYFYNLHKFVNFHNPRTFSEKLQWLKIYNKDPRYTTMVDKYSVKEYVSKVIGSEYVIPTYGVWDSPDIIDWKNLPPKFVLKTTHAGGGSGVVICDDIESFDKEEATIKLMNSYMTDTYATSKEWPYKNVPRRIIAEQLLESKVQNELLDYKWYCFNGEPKYCQVIKDRKSKETIDFFDVDWNHQEFIGLVGRNTKVCHSDIPPQRPENLNIQLSVARKLSKDLPFSRIDLYEVDGRVYFGEITFFPLSGMGKFIPEKYNMLIGDMLELPNDFVTSK